MPISPKYFPLNSATRQEAHFQLLTIQAAMINQIAQAIRGKLVLDDVLQSLAHQLCDTLKVTGCLIFPEEQVKPLAQYGRVPSSPLQLWGVCRDFFDYYHSRLAQGKLLFIPINKRQLPAALHNSAQEVGFSSLLIVPFLYRQSYIGNLTLYECEQKRQWLPQEIAFVQAIADQCTTALALAKLEERASSEAKRRLATERCLNALCNETGQLMGLLTPEGIIVEANQTALEFAGLQDQALLGLPFWEAPWWVSSSDRDQQLQEAFSQRLFRSVAAAAKGQCSRYEVNVLGKDNRLATLEISLTPHLDETGKVILLVFEGRDITEHKRSQLELQKSLIRNEALLEAIPALVLRLTRDGIYLDCKTAHEELLVLPPADCIGKHLHQVLPQKAAGLLWHHIELAFLTNQIQVIEYQLWIKGKSHDFEARIVKSGNDEVVVIVQDVTQRVQSRVALQQINEALEIRVNERTAALREANHILRAEIVERRKAEEQLRESEERFRQSVVNAPFPIMIHAEDGEIVQINQVWTELTGYTHDDIPTVGIWTQKAYRECTEAVQLPFDLANSLVAELCPTLLPLHEDAAESFRRHYELNEQHIEEGEVPVITKDGNLRVWEFRSAPSGRLTDGRLLTISMAIDVTERQEAERAARFLHSVTQAIFESQDFQTALNVALQKVCEATGWDFGEAWIPSADGSVLECSPAWYGKNESLEPFRRASETMTFVSGEGIPGRVWASKQPEWRRDVSSESGAVYLRSDLAKEVGLRAGLGIPLLTTSGVLAVLVFYMFESQNEDQKLIELISASTELGLMIQRKQAEEEVRKALVKEKELTELKSRFISMTSHEFRTPLTTIQSSAELLEYYGQKWSQEKKLTHMHRIQSSVKHMTKLLDDVLVIGKAEAGKLTFNPSPLDVEQFCRNLVEELKLNDTNQHTITFICDWEPRVSYKSDNSVSSPASSSQELAPTTLPCLDEKLLRQILENLLSNAIKYSPEGSTIEFSLARFSTQAIFKIRDQGIGIPPEDQRLLFESFHRATNVGTIAGTGLGLTIVKKCVDIHKGQVAVESEVGVGTTFTVTLPI